MILTTKQVSKIKMQRINLFTWALILQSKLQSHQPPVFKMAKIKTPNQSYKFSLKTSNFDGDS